MKKEVIFSLEAPFRDAIDIHRIRFGRRSEHPDVQRHIAIVAGLHGNEVGGVCVANQLVGFLKTLSMDEDAIDGCIDIYPVINRMGLDETSKRNPLDFRDINRWFPGNPQGSASERIAAAVFAEVEPCDWVISIHTGAEHVEDLPQIRCRPEQAQDFSTVGIPLLWIQKELDGLVSLLGQCAARKQNTLYITGGNGNSVNLSVVEQMKESLIRVLSRLGFISEPMLGLPSTVVFQGSMTELRTSMGGFLMTRVSVGDVLREGEVVAIIQDVVGGDILETILAPFHATVVSTRVNPIVYPYEMVLKLIPHIGIV